MPYSVNPDHGYLEWKDNPGGAGIDIQKINVDDFTAPGTDPVVADAAGQITVTGGQVASGTIANSIQTKSLAANTYTIQVQQAGESTTENTALNGVAHFNDNEFVVSNGFVSLRNTFVDQAQTIGAVTADITTIPLTAAGTYTFEVRVSAWESTGPAGKGFSVNGVARSDGVTATLISDADGFNHSDASLVAADVDIVDSGINAIVRVTGVAGLTINWGAVTVYVFRGA